MGVWGGVGGTGDGRREVQGGGGRRKGVQGKFQQCIRDVQTPAVLFSKLGNQQLVTET